MPVTPFHFGVGLLFKGAAPARVSFLAFVTSQVVIDLETVYFIVTGQWPLHRAFDTFALAVPLGVAVGVLVWLGGRHVSNRRERWRVQLGLLPSAIGGAAGGLTHPLLDGVMHPDIHPLSPFSSNNPLYRVIGLLQLHLLCLAAAVAGGLLWAARTRKRQQSTP